MALDPWGPIVGVLFEGGSSDDILGAVQRAGVSTGFNLTEKEAYSHQTRKRAYHERIDKFYFALQPADKHRVAQNLAREVAKAENGLERLNAALKGVGWSFQDDQLVSLSPEETGSLLPGDASTPVVARPDRVQTPPPKAMNETIFIGHGRSKDWLELERFLKDRLDLKPVDFNTEAVAGKTTVERLQELLNSAAFAFLVMTAEDTHPDGTTHARENVIHEAGLFQGKLGFERAIILLEDGCAQFSNIHGLTHIGFPRGNLGAAFEKIRQVLEREGML